MLMTAEDYRESLRAYSPRVFVGGEQVESVADEPRLAPGINAVGVTYDFALRKEYEHWMTATQSTSGEVVNRMIHVNRNSEDLLEKLEAVRLICRQSGCAQRYLSHDALNAIYKLTARLDEASQSGEWHARFLSYLHDIQSRDLTLGVAMTDAKGDRRLRPHQQPMSDSYLHVKERRPDGIVIQGVKAIVTGAPYMHELLVMPCRNMTEADRDFADCCAVPVDVAGLTIVSRPAGRPGQPGAKFSALYGQSTAVCHFEDVFVPWDKVFLDGQWDESGFLVSTYANHHRHSCIGARAGFGDLLIGAGVSLAQSNGLEPNKVGHIRDSMVELIKIVEGFYACGVASSVYGLEDASGAWQPEPVFANVGKLLLATQIFEMHRRANEVSGGLVVTLPTPDEDHNPHTEGNVLEMLNANPAVSATHRAELARMMEDLTASDTGGWYSIISLHGGGSPEAMKREIYRNYPVEERQELVRQLLDRGVAGMGTGSSGAPSRQRQPGQCCPVGCKAPDIPGSESG